MNKLITEIESEIKVLKEKIQELRQELPNCKVQLSLFYDNDDFFYEISAYKVDNILYAGEKPYSLFFQEEIIDELKAKGITHIINLMQSHEYKCYDTSLFSNNFKITNIELVDNSVPEIDKILEVLYAIDNNEKTYLHCNLGLGRTGVMVAVYLSKKYAFVPDTLISKIEELKQNSKLHPFSSPVTKEQREFVKSTKFR